MLDRFFRLSENHTNVRTELLAGLTTFLTMAYIIVVQPMVLSGRMAGHTTRAWTSGPSPRPPASRRPGLGHHGALRPISHRPGPRHGRKLLLRLAAACRRSTDRANVAGQIAPADRGSGVVFYSGVIFLLLSMLGVREKLMEAISPSMRNGIAIGIGLFIVVIGMNSTRSAACEQARTRGWRLNPHFASPDLIVFFFGLLVTAALHARRVRGLDHSGHRGGDGAGRRR